ncbi:unnamed protein product [Somion occarium]
MSERIRQLEDALAIFQAGVSSERHPLLRDELLSIKFGPEVRRTVDEEHSRNALSQTIDALGTLTVGDHGETKFIGRSGGTETLFMAFDSPEWGAEPEDSVELELPTLDHELANLSITFPLNVVPEGVDAILDKLEKHLPPHPRAWALCEAYLEHFTWWFRPLKRDELIDEILSPIYKCLTDPNRRSYFAISQQDNRCPHRLAVLYFILAIGALVDLTLPACNVEAEKYFQLGRATLSLRSIFDSPEVETVQAVSLMAAYQSACSQRYSNDSAWSVISLAVKLAQSLGLHRDSSQWKLDPKIVQRRRNLFWELATFEATHCISLGRPTSISEVHIDCELPLDEEETIGEDGEKISGFWFWKMNYAKTVFIKVIDTLLSAKAPNYESVLEMDRKIRQAELPKVKLYLKPGEDDYTDPGACMRSYLMSQIRSISMLAIHRTFFAQALLDHPTNPLRSPYAPSFLSINRCACILIRSFLHHFERRPDLCGRFWNIWTHAFTAAVVLGSTVKWCPSATMAPSSLIELDLAIELFKRGANSSPRARMAVPILTRLKERATLAYQQFRNRRIAPTTLDIQMDMGPEDTSEDKLAMFGGQTRVVSTKLLTRKRPKNAGVATHSPSASTSRSTTASSDTSPRSRHASDSPVRHDPPSPADSVATPAESIPESLMAAFNEVHPTLVEYLSFFPSSAAVVDTSKCLVDPPTASSSSIPNSPPTIPNSQTSLPASFVRPQQPSSSMSPFASPQNTHIFPQSNFNYYAGPSQPTETHRAMETNAVFAMGPNGNDVVGIPQMLNFSDEMMDEQWMNLMRDTGVFDVGNGYTNGFNFPGPSQQSNGNGSNYQPPNGMI